MRCVKAIVHVLAWFGFALTCWGQANAIISPEVLADRRVTFRLAATNAQAVEVFADWMTAGKAEPLKKNGAGVWECTVGPLDPGIYVYHLIVDGLSMADPVNPRVKLRARTSASLLEVPGTPAEDWEFRDVPHGKVEINFHKASALGNARREVWVYTPPGYDEDSSRRYPVLYLLHGSNDTPAGWTQVGRANFTMDNLLAEGKAREMILVTPFGHAQPFESRDGKNSELFENYLLKNVIPLIEAEYRVAGGRANRAIAGFSMGGGHAMRIGLNHLEMFSAIGLFSPGVPRDLEKGFAAVLTNTEKANEALDLLWIACGREDFLFQAAENLSATLKQRGIEHEYHPTEGAHTFNVWRRYFREFAPRLFQAAAGAK
jgi:enterochelin esterase-like enzyme